MLGRNPGPGRTMTNRCHGQPVEQRTFDMLYTIHLTYESSSMGERGDCFYCHRSSLIYGREIGHCAPFMAFPLVIMKANIRILYSTGSFILINHFSLTMVHLVSGECRMQSLEVLRRPVNRMSATFQKPHYSCLTYINILII